jgi:hypothetical protein
VVREQVLPGIVGILREPGHSVVAILAIKALVGRVGNEGAQPLVTAVARQIGGTSKISLVKLVAIRACLVLDGRTNGFSAALQRPTLFGLIVLVPLRDKLCFRRQRQCN